jgi:molecular chaperone DnaJ
MDLVVQFKIQPDPKWRRDRLNLHCDTKLSIWDLILGAETEITTIVGTKLIARIPNSTQPGTIMRLRGHGLTDRNGATGDLLIKIQAEIPKNIAPEIVASIQQHRN